MKYLSVCAGIEAATVAWHPLGWEPVAFSEIEKFPNMVLDHHYPDVPNYGDMTDHEQWPETDFDVLVGGTPCQSFSVAGLRAGMADPRGNLALVYLAIADQYRPRWLVWENVPGVLSSNEGRDFGAIIGGMVELGYSPTWRVLDAQYFGVAQRRRRLFVVASSRDWRDSAEVLLEPSCLRRHPAPSRETGQGVAGPLGGSSQSGGFRTTDLDNSGAFIPDVVGALSDGAHCGGGLNGQDAYSGRIIPTTFNWQNGGGYGDANEGLGIVEEGAVIAFKENMSVPSYGTDVGETLQAQNFQAVAFDMTQVTSKENRSQPSDKSPTLAPTAQSPCIFEPRYVRNDRGAPDTVCPPLKAQSGSTGKGDAAPVVASQGMQVRRLTPKECERLQGFPDGYTDIPGASDSGRYKALGNSMAVPVMHWIGQRIAEVSK